MELLRYVTATGADVFGRWLLELRDVQARARINARVNRLALGNFGDCKPLREGVWELRIDWGRAIACITQWPGGNACCFYVEATNESSPPTSNAPSSIGAIISKGHDGHETQSKHFSRADIDQRTPQ
jgi:hypothetical protein